MGQGSACTLQQLCEEDKRKVAGLIRQVVALGQEIDQAKLKREKAAGRQLERVRQLQTSHNSVSQENASVRKKLTQAFALLRAYQTKVSQLSISTDKDLPSSAQGLHVPSAAHSRSHQPQQHRHQQQEQPQPSWQHVSHTADAHLHQADVGRHVCQRARQPEQQQHWTSMPLSHQPHPATSPLDLIEATVAALSSGSSCSSLKHVPPQRLHQPAAAASVPSPGHMHSWPNLCHLGSSVSPSSSCHEHLGQHSMQWPLGSSKQSRPVSRGSSGALIMGEGSLQELVQQVEQLVQSAANSVCGRH